MAQEQLILTREQVRQCDVVAIEKYQIPSIVLMENAGIGAATIIKASIESVGDHKVLVVCGSGNNGGDGYVVARQLAKDGISVTVVITCDRDKICGDALINLTVIEKMEMRIVWLGKVLPKKQSLLQEVLGAHKIVVDALFGTGLTNNVRASSAWIIEALNDASCEVTSLDVPSGLDCNSGLPLGCSVIAEHTITFVAIKTGFLESVAAQYIGKVTVVDIGIDPKLLARVKI